MVQRLRDGDELAFELLFYRYRGKVANFINLSLPRYADREEVVLEIFLQIWISREKIDAQRPFAPYLFKVARNKVIDILRKKVESTVYLLDEPFKLDLSINDGELKLEEKELEDWFWATLDRLPEKRKEIFRMSRFEGMSYPEIAKKLDISENTVDTQIRRSLQFFKEEIKKLKTILLILF